MCKPDNAQDPELLIKGSLVEQHAVLAAYAQMFDFLHAEQTLNAQPLFHPQVQYMTILRHPIRRLLSHFRMGTQPIHVPGYWNGSPFGRNVTIREFVTGPITGCPLCLASRHGIVTRTSMSGTAGGAGDFRHCCRKPWRYASDNYFTRELTGKYNLETLNWGLVTEAHFEVTS